VPSALHFGQDIIPVGGQFFISQSMIPLVSSPRPPIRNVSQDVSPAAFVEIECDRRIGQIGSAPPEVTFKPRRHLKFLWPFTSFGQSDELL